MPIPPPPDSKQVFKGFLYDIYQVPRTQFDGTTKTFEYLIRPDSVTIIPFITRDEILLTRQEQPGREPFLDFPGGRMEPGEEPETCAARELLEETGYRAGRLLPIWRYGNNGSSRFEKHFFLATDLTADHDAAQPDSGERISLLKETVEMTKAHCLNHELRQFDAMLCFLGLCFDPEKSRALEAWLAQETSSDPTSRP